MIVYVNYFRIPVTSFVFNGLGGIGKGIRRIFSKSVDFVTSLFVLFVECKEYISMLLFSRKEQVKFNFLSRNLCSKTVLL